MGLHGYKRYVQGKLSANLCRLSVMFCAAPLDLGTVRARHRAVIAVDV